MRNFAIYRLKVKKGDLIEAQKLISENADAKLKISTVSQFSLNCPRALKPQNQNESITLKLCIVVVVIKLNWYFQ